MQDMDVDFQVGLRRKPPTTPLAALKAKLKTKSTEDGEPREPTKVVPFKAPRPARAGARPHNEQSEGSQKAVIDVAAVDKEVRRVAGCVHSLTADVSVLKESIVSLEVGQATNEVYMKAIMGAHGLKEDDVMARIEQAKARLASSHVDRGLLPPPSPSPMTGGQAVGHAGTGRNGDAPPGSRIREKPDDTPQQVPKLGQNMLQCPVSELTDVALHGLLVEHGGPEAPQQLKYTTHSDYVAALSHAMPRGLPVVLKVISSPHSPKPWSMQYARVCDVTRKGSLTWALDINADPHFAAGRGWSMEISDKARYNVPMHMVFVCPEAATDKVDSLNPPKKSMRLLPPEAPEEPRGRGGPAETGPDTSLPGEAPRVTDLTQIHSQSSQDESLIGKRGRGEVRVRQHCGALYYSDLSTAHGRLISVFFLHSLPLAC